MQAGHKRLRKVYNKFLFSNKKILIPVVFFIFLIPLLFLLISLGNRKTQNVANRDLFDTSVPYIPEQIIVKYKDEYDEKEIKSVERKLKELDLISQEKIFDSDDPLLRNFYLLQFKPGIDIKKVKNTLLVFPQLEFVKPNYIAEINETPNDPQYLNLWGLSKIEAPLAWDITKGGESIKVAVIDTGIDVAHEDFSNRSIINGQDFFNKDSNSSDDNGHGTHIAGTIGAVTNNGVGVAGVNWNVTLMAVKALGANGKGPNTNVVRAIRYAADSGANVINLSLGIDNNCSLNPEFGSVINYALQKGAIIVTAAGNSNKDVLTTTPASCKGVIAVGATDQSDNRASFSNWGERVDVSAPGVSILSTWPGNLYITKQGTSAASPYVSGVVALLLSMNPSLSQDQARLCLVNGADPIVTDKPIGPRLNALKSIQACVGISPSPSPTVSTLPSPFPTAIKSAKIAGTVFIDLNSDGQRNVGEPGYAGAQITTEGPTILSAFSDAGGNFLFPSVSPGTYIVNLWIDGIVRSRTQPQNLAAGFELTAEFSLPPEILTPTKGTFPSPTPIVINPSPVPIRGASPSPSQMPTQQTYTCREQAAGVTPLPGAIKIGSLDCAPN